MDIAIWMDCLHSYQAIGAVGGNIIACFEEASHIVTA
jgi:hypothetical protein